MEYIQMFSQTPRLGRLTFTSTVDGCCWQCCLDRKLDLQISDIFSGDSAAKMNIWQRLVAPCFSVQRLHVTSTSTVDGC